MAYEKKIKSTVDYIKENVDTTITKSEIARLLKNYADEIKHSIEEKAIRNNDNEAKTFAKKSEDDKYYFITHTLIEVIKENLKSISSNDVMNA